MFKDFRMKKGSRILFNTLGMMVQSLWDEGFKCFRMKTGSKIL